jgi:hypothetical protein
MMSGPTASSYDSVQGKSKLSMSAERARKEGRIPGSRSPTGVTTFSEHSAAKDPVPRDVHAREVTRVPERAARSRISGLLQQI